MPIAMPINPHISTPNHSKHNCDITSTYFNPVKLRNEEISPEPSTVDNALKQKHIKQIYRYNYLSK